MSGGEASHRIFVVEDDAMVLMLIEDLLQELGHRVVGTATKLEAALASIKEVDFDLAILDVNLGGKSAQPIASLLRALGCPFIIATGYPEETLGEDYLSAPVIEKPFLIEAVAEAIRQVELGRKYIL